MKHFFFILSILLVALSLGSSIWMGMPFCSIGLLILLVVLIFMEYSHTQSLRKQKDIVERDNARLRAHIVDNERQLHQMRQLTEDVETAIIVVTPSGHVEWSNQMARLMLGLDLDVLPESIMQAMRERRDEVDGMALSATLIRIEGRRRIVLALKDIHQQMERQKMEAWQQLIRVLIHEIRNSITPIISICQQIQAPDVALEKEDLSISMRLVERRCRTLMEFMENYRQLSYLKPPHKQPFPVAELMTDLQAMYPICHFNVSPTGLMLTADRTQIEQVLINLVKNALEANATSIQLEASNQGITVSDNGQGIPPAVLEEIFKPF
ncbi:MAG: ATP-binding protein, partial [Bacteroidaceae bacterium]|nr:ATP-binding protein [Bacteroidaceae bacterium]